MIFFVSDIPLRVNGEIDGDSLEQKDRYRTPHDFKLYPDGSWEVLTKQSEDGYQNITLDYPAMNGYEKVGDQWIKTSGDYIAIYDQNKKTIAPFAEYKSSMISGINFDGDYSIVKISGTDGKSYFTVINSIGEMQFEPMVYSGSTPTCSSEKVVYTNTSGKYIITDTSGNIIAIPWYADYVYDRDEFSITDAYVLDINFTVKGDEGTESFHYPEGLLVIKENGKWRISRGSISCSFYDNQ